MRRWLTFGLLLAMGCSAATEAYDDADDDRDGALWPASDGDGKADSITTPPSRPMRGQVVFTFDDGCASLGRAREVLAARHLPGVAYLITDEIGSVDRVAWSDVATLASAGWEIGSHTATHPDLATLSTAQIQSELDRARTALRAHGYSATGFAPPYGSYDDRVLALAAQRHGYVRPFEDSATQNTWPAQTLALRTKTVQVGTSPAMVAGWIDAAARDHTLLVLVLHDIVEVADADDDPWAYAEADLAAIADYAQRAEVEVTTLARALAPRGTNLIPNGDFAAGRGAFTTDAPSRVAAVRAGGRAPGASRALRLTASTTAATHVFAPLVSVDASTTYLLGAYLDTTSLATGTVGLYVDEYDANDTWIDGTYLGEWSQVTEPVVAWQPKRTTTKRARVQIFVDHGRGSVTLDEVRLIPAASP